MQIKPIITGGGGNNNPITSEFTITGIASNEILKGDKVALTKNLTSSNIIKLANPSVLPTSTIFSCAISKDGKHIVLNNGYVYRNDNDILIKEAINLTTSSEQASRIIFSEDNKLLFNGITNMQTGIAINLYDYDGTTFTLKSDYGGLIYPTTVQHMFKGYDITFDKKYVFLSIYQALTNKLIIFKNNGDDTYFILEEKIISSNGYVEVAYENDNYYIYVGNVTLKGNNDIFEIVSANASDASYGISKDNKFFYGAQSFYLNEDVKRTQLSQNIVTSSFSVNTKKFIHNYIILKQLNQKTIKITNKNLQYYYPPYITGIQSYGQYSLDTDSNFNYIVCVGDESPYMSVFKVPQYNVLKSNFAGYGLVGIAKKDANIGDEIEVDILFT